MTKQFVVRNLEESAIRRLKRRARTNGRSFEGEVREILRAATQPESKRRKARTQKGLGTQLAEIFAGKVPPEFEIPNIRGELVRPAKFDE
jgi:plasmid stability protein